MRKSFENWLWEEIEQTFGLSQTNLPALTNWLNNQQPITPEEAGQVAFLLKIVSENFKDWNEDELKMQFIAPLLLVINYYDTEFRAFSQRNLSARINDWELHGRVDWMLAKGKQIPRKPYFFLHEYKSERGRDNDPQGQLLAEMLAAQSKNEDGKAVYGAYIVGKDWYFMVLLGLEYSVSRPYQANESADLDVIVKALKEVKGLLSASL